MARRLLHDYEFADTSIVRAVYHPDRPLEKRDMLLEVRYWGLRFHLGVRVAGVLDETRSIDGREVRVWGGTTRRSRATSRWARWTTRCGSGSTPGWWSSTPVASPRHAQVANPIIRLGLRLFGRHEQVKFARRACARMARLTADALHQADTASAPQVADNVECARPVERTCPRRQIL